MKNYSLKRYHLGKRQSFATKKVLLEKIMKNHKQNWNHFSEEPKFDNKSGTILGNLPPIREKILNLTQEIFVNLAPSNPPSPKLNPLSPIFYIHHSLISDYKINISYNCIIVIIHSFITRLFEELQYAKRCAIL